MTEHKTKDQEEKGDVTLHGGKPVSPAQAAVEAEVGGPIDSKAVHKAKDKAEKPQKGHAEDEGAGPATWHNHPTGNALSQGLGAVPVYETVEKAHEASKKEAEAAGVTPAAVMNSAPDGGSSGADD